MPDTQEKPLQEGTQARTYSPDPVPDCARRGFGDAWRDQAIFARISRAIGVLEDYQPDYMQLPDLYNAYNMVIAHLAGRLAALEDEARYE